MDWEHRRPDGVGEIEHTAEGFTAPVSIPLDSEGYFGRECPSCDAPFKMRHDEYRALPDQLELTCPYCGHREEHSSFLSTAQRERVMAAAKGLAEQMVHGMLNDMLSKTFGRPQASRPGSFLSIQMSYTPGSPPPIRQLPEIVEEQIQRVIQCSSCTNHHAVYSATAFCPLCGPRPAAVNVLESISTARQALAVEDRLQHEERQQFRAGGVFERFAVDAIESVVSLFEVFAREQFHLRAQSAEDAVRGKGNVFQRLEDTAGLFAQYANVDLLDLAGQDRWRRLKVAFAQRHVLTHRGGIIDERFLDQAPSAGKAVGQRLVIRRPDAEAALDDLEGLVRALHETPLPGS